MNYQSPIESSPGNALIYWISEDIQIQSLAVRLNYHRTRPGSTITLEDHSYTAAIQSTSLAVGYVIPVQEDFQIVPTLGIGLMFRQFEAPREVTMPVVDDYMISSNTLSFGVEGHTHCSRLFGWYGGAEVYFNATRFNGPYSFANLSLYVGVRIGFRKKGMFGGYR